MDKFKKILVAAFALTLVIGLTACGDDEDGDTGSKDEIIKLLNNKPEIDAQLKDLAAAFEEETGHKVEVTTCGGDGCETETELNAAISRNDTPDIFVIDGDDAYNKYSKYLDDLSDEEWTENTEVAYTDDGTVYGFPVAIEGWGLGYNADMLEEAGIDPSTLTNYGAYQEAFTKLDGMKEELGIDSVVAMAAGPGMYWVTGDHNLNSYLSNGLEYGDATVADDALNGEFDDDRLSEYVDWVELLFNYSDNNVLLTGDYDSQVGQFANEKAAFVHQGNWIEGNLTDAEFDRGFAPHGSMSEDTEGIFVSAPSWYVVNKDGDADIAKEFLNYIATSDAGVKFYEDSAGIPAISTIDVEITAPLSKAVYDYNVEGNIYSWNQYMVAKETRDNLGSIYELFAKGEIDKEQFIELFKAEISS